MLLSALSALGTFAVSVPAYFLLARRTYTSSYRILCLAVVFLGMAKLCRFRPIADHHVEPGLYTITSVHNLPIGLAATCAIAAYTAVLLAAVSDATTRRRIVSTVGVITLAFWVCFIIGYGGTASGRPASDGLGNPVQALTWALPLLIVLIVSTAVVAIAAREIHLRRPRAGVGVPHGLILAGIGGVFYSLNKVAHIGLSTIGAPGFLISGATFIGLVALPMSVLVLAVVVYSPPLTEFANRTWRYRQLRVADSSLRPAPAWSLAASAQDSHAFMVDVADETIVSASRDTTN